MIGRRYRISFAACCLTLFVLLVSCSSQAEIVRPPGAESEEAAAAPEIEVSGHEGTRMNTGQAVSDVARQIHPVIPAGEFEQLVEGNTEFAFDFYRRLSEEQGNLFFSPYSVSLALAMTYAGARADTEAQMGEVMHFSLPQHQLHPAFNQLDLMLGKLDQDRASPEPGQEFFQLSIANSLWGQQGYPFLPDFLDLLALNYGAGIQLVDYAQQTEAARMEINRWVSDATEGKIQDLIPEGALNELTRLVLANAIYFKAQWLHPFNPESTLDAPFTLLDGSQVSVPTMRQTQSLGLAQGTNYLALELPYQGRTTSMLLIVPDSGAFVEVQDRFDHELWQQVVENLRPTRIQLSLPRFQYESGFALRPVLESMGMLDAFSIERADFSGMDGSLELFVHDVLHKAYVSVDEEGTEAAAATAVIMASKAMLDPPLEIRVDRPFLFFIRDLETDTILFVGRVLNPAE